MTSVSASSSSPGSRLPSGHPDGRTRDGCPSGRRSRSRTRTPTHPPRIRRSQIERRRGTSRPESLLLAQQQPRPLRKVRRRTASLDPPVWTLENRPAHSKLRVPARQCAHQPSALIQLSASTASTSIPCSVAQRSTTPEGARRRCHFLEKITMQLCIHCGLRPASVRRNP